MVENKLEKSENTEEADIFEGFASDAELLQEVDEFEQKQSKDIYDYANISGNMLKGVNVILIVVLLFTGLYVYVQRDADLLNSKVIDPFCSFLLGDVTTSNTYCSSVAAVKIQFSETQAAQKKQHFEAIANIIQPLYLSTDFVNSSEVTFLYDKSKTRLRPLAILQEFDNLKNNFEQLDKSALECGDIEIRGNIMSAKCDAYSSDWDKSIVLPDGETSENIGGTSISIASSFLDYIESNSPNIRVLDKPKYFSTENVSGENGGYTKKTTFFLQLEHNEASLSL